MLERVAANRVHLRMQRHRQHAVAQIDEARAGIRRDDALLSRALRRISSPGPAGPSGEDRKGFRRARLRRPARTGRAAIRIPTAWRDRCRRWNTRSRARPPQCSEATGGSVAWKNLATRSVPENSFRIRSGSGNGAAASSDGSCDRLPRSILHRIAGSSAQMSVSPAAFFPAFVKSATGLFANPAARHHLAHERRKLKLRSPGPSEGAQQDRSRRARGCRGPRCLPCGTWRSSAGRSRRQSSHLSPRRYRCRRRALRRCARGRASPRDWR